MKKIPPAKPPWKIDPSIDVNRISLEDVKLIFAQAEKRLDDTVKTGELIAGKTMTLMTLMVGILVALSGFLISNWSGWAQLNAREFVAMIGALYIVVLFTYMLKNVLPNDYFVLGSDPRHLMTPNFFDKSVPKEKITVFLYMSEIENYDFRIEYNRTINMRRIKRYRDSVIAVWILPLLLGIIYTFCV